MGMIPKSHSPALCKTHSSGMLPDSALTQELSRPWPAPPPQRWQRRRSACWAAHTCMHSTAHMAATNARHHQYIYGSIRPRLRAARMSHGNKGLARDSPKPRAGRLLKASPLGGKALHLVKPLYDTGRTIARTDAVKRMPGMRHLEGGQRRIVGPPCAAMKPARTGRSSGSAAIWVSMPASSSSSCSSSAVSCALPAQRAQHAKRAKLCWVRQESGGRNPHFR